MTYVKPFQGGIDMPQALGKGFWLVLCTSAGSAGGPAGMALGASIATLSANIIGDWVGGNNKEFREASPAIAGSYFKELFDVFTDSFPSKSNSTSKQTLATAELPENRAA